jgi:hypothetical protein
MATKVKCSNCGAKNPTGQHRCRLCTHVIDPTAAEGLSKGAAKQAKLDARLASAAARRLRPADPDEWQGGPVATPDATPDATPEGPLPPAEPVVAGPPVVFDAPPAPPADDELDEPADLPDGAIVIDAAPRHIANPIRDEPVGEAFDSDESWDAVGGIEIDVVRRNEDPAPPPLAYDDDGGFDPDALVIDPPR